MGLTAEQQLADDPLGRPVDVDAMSPLLLMASYADRTVPIAGSLALHARFPTTTTFVELHGAHIQDPTAVKQAGRWLDTGLPGLPPLDPIAVPPPHTTAPARPAPTPPAPAPAPPAPPPAPAAPVPAPAPAPPAPAPPPPAPKSPGLHIDGAHRDHHALSINGHIAAPTAIHITIRYRARGHGRHSTTHPRIRHIAVHPTPGHWHVNIRLPGQPREPIAIVAHSDATEHFEPGTSVLRLRRHHPHGIVVQIASWQPHRRRLRVKLRCTRRHRCKGRIRLRTRARGRHLHQVGHRRYNVRHGHHRIGVRLRRRARRKIRQRGHLRVRAIATLRGTHKTARDTRTLHQRRQDRLALASERESGAHMRNIQG